MARHEEPVRARRPKQSADACRGHGPQAPARDRRCPGAAAQLAAVHRTLRHGPVLQLEAGGAAAANRTGLPDRLKAGVETLSGVSLDGVKVHYNSSKPAQLNALAYAQGSDIHLAPGQEQHLPHETWHIVQQAQGRVKPTMQMKNGVPVNDDAGLEREADAMGEAALGHAPSPAAEPILHRLSWRPEAMPVQRMIEFEYDDATGEELSVNLRLTAHEVYQFLVHSRGLKSSERMRSWLRAQDGVNAIFSDSDELIQVMTDHGVFDHALRNEEYGAEGWYRPGDKPGEEGVWEDWEGGEVEDPGERALLAEEEAALEEEAQPTLDWKIFKKKYSIESSASRFTQDAETRNILEPAELPPSKSPIGYVANILTIPKNPVTTIINNYAAGGISSQNYGSFAMVIGVNTYRSLDGMSFVKVQKAAMAASKASFHCTIIGFMWDFFWGSPFKQVQADFLKMSRADREQALDEERAHLVQSIIPYGQLRERVTADEATRNYVRDLQTGHDAVYIHLGDDDAVSLPDFPLLDNYTRTITERGLPPLVVGGYEFRTRDQGGDLRPDDPGEALTAIASELDILFRGMLPAIDSDLVYPTEPNMAFLAATRKDNILERMIPDKQQEKPDKKISQQEKLLRTREAQARSVEEGSFEGKARFSTGLPYGLGTNEGERLRSSLKTTMGSSKPGFTVYDPRLGIPTASTRFTLRDEDRVKHETGNPTYGQGRKSAFKAKSRDGFMEQIVTDLLTIKQSHIGGLKKEITNREGKNAPTIAKDVVAVITALLLGKKPPETSKVSADYIKLIMKNSEMIGPVANKVQREGQEMLRRLEETLKKESEQL